MNIFVMVVKILIVLRVKVSVYQRQASGLVKSTIIAWGVEIGSQITETTWKSGKKENDFGGCLNDNRLFLARFLIYIVCE